MKMLTDVTVEGLEALLGKRVTLLCANYFYTGQLVGVNSECVKLTEAKVVYETGPLTYPKETAEKDKGWKDAHDLPGEWYVMKGAIESFGILK